MIQRVLLKKVQVKHLRKTSIQLCFYSKAIYGSRNEKPMQELVEKHKCVAIQSNYIPVTKKILLNKIVEQKNFLHGYEADQVLEFARQLDSTILKDSFITLNEMKLLYDSLNPDKEFRTKLHIGKKEHLDNEFLLLQKLASQLQTAKYQELSREHLEHNLIEHHVSEGVLVHVDFKQYDIIRVWVLGEENKSLINDWRDKVQHFFINLYKKQQTFVPIYKRVVIAVRTKKQNKLMLKAFKDLPKSNIEYFLPEGKITMSFYDKSFIATLAIVCSLSVVVKLCTTFFHYNAQWTFILGSVTGLIGLHTWNSYKNKRNQYLTNISKALYYKTLASNKAILGLITDRAADEVFKSSLLCYNFIKMKNMKDMSTNFVPEAKLGITVEDLKISVENWLFNEFHITFDFDPQDGLRKLEQLGLLKVTKRGLKTHLDVLALDQSLNALPSHSIVFSDHHDDNLLEIEKIPLGNVALLKEKNIEKFLQEKAERCSPGWS